MLGSLYFILTSLYVTNVAMGQRQQATTSMYTGEINNCSLGAILHREILEVSTAGIGGNGKIDCMRQCIRNSHCEVVVYQLYQTGSESCMKLSKMRPDFVGVPILPGSIVCVTVYIRPCRNGGQMYEGVCLCRDEFTGQACEYANPRVCRVDWMTAATAGHGSLSSDGPVSGELGHTNAKMVIRNSKLKVLSVMRSMDSDTYFQQKSDSWFFVSFPFFEKESWNKFSPNPQRQLMHAKINGDVQLLSLNRTFGNYNFSQSREKFSFITPRQTRFAVKRNLPEDKALIVDDIRDGFELFDSTWINVNEENDVIVAQLTERFLNVILGGHFIVPPMRVDYKYVLGQMTYMTGFFVGSGAFSGTGNQQFSKVVYLNPCWRGVTNNGYQVNSSASVWKMLGTYLRLGNDVRIKIRSTYHTVLETIIVGDSFTLLLAPFLSQKEPASFTSEVYEIRSLITSPGIYRSCSHQAEQEQVIDISYYQYPEEDVEWFVDTRKWNQVFSVFSNASVADGSMTDLISGITKGSDVRIWIKWLDTGVSRFLDTHMSSVTDDGKVSTESLVTWRTTLDSVVSLSSVCDLQYVLVTSDGHVEILMVNINTPGRSEVQSDVLVSWFLA